jgi:hypothetical protein
MLSTFIYSCATGSQTLLYFEKLLQDLDHICSLPAILGLEELLQFVIDFQKSQPDLFARARLQVHITSI